MDLMGMLRIGIKTAALFIVVVFLGSCKDDKFVLYEDRYQGLIMSNFNSYDEIYNEINDTINEWVTDSLGKSLSLHGNSWQLDSAIVFNKDSSRLFTTVNIRASGWKDAELDYIYEFGGAYIENEWFYYFLSTSMPVSRVSYKDNLFTPYSFDELSYIAHKSSFGNMLKVAEDGSFILNEKSFNSKFFDLKNDKSFEIEKAYRDSKLIEKKHHKNTRGKLKKETIEEIKAEMEVSVRPPEPVKEVKENSWWDKIFGEPEEIKLFESEAWKNRYKK